MWSTADVALRVALPLTLLVSGCVTTQPAPSSAWECRPSGVAGQVRVVTVAAGTPGQAGGGSIVLGPEVGGVLEVRRAAQGRSAVGLPKLGLGLVNCGERPLVLRLRTQFLDAAGGPSEPVSAWRELIVGARSGVDVDELSTRAASIGFRAEIDRVDAPARP